jgi:hypothetical protein
VRREHEVCNLGQFRPRNLNHHVRHALPDLGGGRVDLRDQLPVGVDEEPDARGAVVVESLRVADVLEAEGEAEPTANAVTACGVAGSAGEPDRVARKLLRLRLLERGAATNDLGDGQRAVDPLPCGQRASRSQRVAETQLDRVELELDRKLVHLGLSREAGLHGAESAHGTAGRIVREDDLALDERVRDRVRPAGEGGRVRADGCRAGRVRASVQEDPHADVDELAASIGSVLGPDPRRMAMNVAREGLLPVVDHLHRAIRPECKECAVDLHGEVFAPAEGAAHAGQVDPYLLGLQIEAGCDLVAIDVEPLRRDVDVDATLAVGDCQARLRPEERLVLDAELVDAFYAHLTSCERVAVDDPHLATDVLGVLGVNDRLLWDVVDRDLVGRAAGLFGVLGGDNGDRLAEVPHVLEGEYGLVGELEAVALFTRNVLVGEDGVNARHLPGLAGVDALDARSGVRATERVPEEHPGREEVARVGELAGDLGDRVDAADRLSDASVLELARGRVHRLVSPRVSAQSARHVRVRARSTRKRVVVRGGPIWSFIRRPPASLRRRSSRIRCSGRGCR